jgi:signal transduction histidine kinase
MTHQTNAHALRPAILARRLDTSALPAWPWERALAVLAVAAAAGAVSVTVSADLLAHRRWLAAQEANLIVGPLLVGLYWMRVRPSSRFGPLLIAYGLVATVCVAESARGLEIVLFCATEAVILSFPTGRLEGSPAQLTTLAAVLAVGLAALDWVEVYRAMVMVAAAATMALLVGRMLRGTPPRRRTLAIGTPVALVFLLAQLSVQGYALVVPGSGEPAWLVWLGAGSWSFICYGFLLALIAAQLFASRVLRDVIGASMRQTSVGELARMLRRPLGDPGLQLTLWQSGGALPALAPGQALTTVERDGRPAAAIVHDAQLSDDPELLASSGGVVLLALENTELNAAWNASLHELADSRARLSEASDRERRKLERDLHDGAQQRLLGIQLKVRMARESAGTGAIAAQLDAIGADAERAVEELRTLAHGIYPPVLRSFGLEAALRAFTMTAPIPVRVSDDGIGRCSRPIESAIYYCAMEAVQNATKHAGDGARVTITLGRARGRLEFAIADDGVGLAGAPPDGQGLVGMRDRIGAVGGRLAIVSAPGAGTTVRGTIPLELGR